MECNFTLSIWSNTKCQFCTSTIKQLRWWSISQQHSNLPGWPLYIQTLSQKWSQGLYLISGSELMNGKDLCGVQRLTKDIDGTELPAEHPVSIRSLWRAQETFIITLQEGREEENKDKGRKKPPERQTPKVELFISSTDWEFSEKALWSCLLAIFWSSCSDLL